MDADVERAAVKEKPAMLHRLLNAGVTALYPPECAGCRQMTEAPHGLCPSCWAGTSFISGSTCDCCGQPVPVTEDTGERLLCELCTTRPPGWDRGRASVLYEGTARKVLLRFKHGDRLDHARVLAGWMTRSGADLLHSADVIAPVPLHWRRLLMRRYNQAAEIIRNLDPGPDVRVIPDLLHRIRPTPKMENMSREARFKTQADAIRLTPRYADMLAGKTVLLIDDVMTTGATLAACTACLRRADAGSVNVLVAARVAREGFGSI